MHIPRSGVQALYYQLRTYLLATRENAMAAVKENKVRQAAAAAAKAAAARSASAAPQPAGGAGAAASPSVSGSAQPQQQPGVKVRQVVPCLADFVPFSQMAGTRFELV